MLAPEVMMSRMTVMMLHRAGMMSHTYGAAQCSQTDNHEDNFAQINFKMSQDVFSYITVF